ncbi:MAG TPA: DUF177 domain-containing protein [Actinomycetota bacterium]|nr:DUF177 domain-containing protein [Actinomycetota bacterium]
MQDLKVSVTELLGRPGAHRRVSVAPTLESVRTDLCELRDEPVAADLTVESVVEGVLVTGPVHGLVLCRCARCLEEFDTPIDVTLCELFAGPGHLEDEDVYRIAGEEIDLEPMLRDELTLALPLNPLCRADCKGLCASCGADLNEGACDCTEETSDPRWAALDAVRDKLETG